MTNDEFHAEVLEAQRQLVDETARIASAVEELRDQMGSVQADVGSVQSDVSVMQLDVSLIEGKTV